MRRRKSTFTEKDDLGVDMTPLLDIVFILLIFFILTTSFVKEMGFVVGKSSAKKSPNSVSTTISIHIDKNNIVYFNNKAVDIIRLPARIEYFIANNSSQNVLLRPHEETTYQTVVEVLDQIKPFSQLKISIGIYKP